MKIKVIVTNNEPEPITVDVVEDKTGEVTIAPGESHTFSRSDGERYFTMKAKRD